MTGLHDMRAVPARPGRRIARHLLGGLLALIALNAFAGGWFGLSGAHGVPIELLEGSPFTSFLIPSLFLFVAIGGTCSYAAVAVFKRLSVAREAALGAAVLLLFWLAAQVVIIGYQSWLQTVTAAAALMVFLLASLLPRR